MEWLYGKYSELSVSHGKPPQPSVGCASSANDAVSSHSAVVSNEGAGCGGAVLGTCFVGAVPPSANPPSERLAQDSDVPPGPRTFAHIIGFSFCGSSSWCDPKVSPAFSR